MLTSCDVLWLALSFMGCTRPSDRAVCTMAQGHPPSLTFGGAGRDSTPSDANQDNGSNSESHYGTGTDDDSNTIWANRTPSEIQSLRKRLNLDAHARVGSEFDYGLTTAMLLNVWTSLPVIFENTDFQNLVKDTWRKGCTFPSFRSNSTVDRRVRNGDLSVLRPLFTRGVTFLLCDFAKLGSGDTLVFRSGGWREP
jgi:hypothetical protein